MLVFTWSCGPPNPLLKHIEFIVFQGLSTWDAIQFASAMGLKGVLTMAHMRSYALKEPSCSASVRSSNGGGGRLVTARTGAT